MRYRSPLQKLIGVWNQIQSNIGGDIVFVFHKPYCRSRKRTFGGNSKSYEVGQLGGCELEARRFAAVIKVLKTMIVNLVQDRTTTKRDVYYQDVGLFQKSQPFANELIECIVGSLGMCAERDLKIFCVAERAYVWQYAVQTCGGGVGLGRAGVDSQNERLGDHGASEGHCSD